ncbi:protein kinase [Streptomyces sp. NPDC056347]|uniref:serine/threonine-protein kinase n=1 Tax=Streptomyces sp. NPDC056347 TaxID=3345790 RepID=UPI0035E275B9
MISHLGSGGFGDVWKAQDKELARDVALKFLALDKLAGPRSSAERSARVRERFARESLAAAKVDSSYVASIHDRYLSESPPFLVMEYVDGQPLAAYLRPTPLTLARTCRWSRQIAQGLAAAHDQNVVHRDVKPGNILIRETDSDVRIVDFGLSRFVDATETHTITGTPLYMSPERCRAEAGDARSDLYSLGCVMYEMVTGMPPFGDERADPIALARAHEERTPRPPGAQGVDIPEPLEALIMDLLAKDPLRRPENARTVVHAITSTEDLLDRRSGKAGPHRFGPTPLSYAQPSLRPAPDSGFGDRLSAAELAVRRLTREHGRDHHLVIAARMELAELTGDSGDPRGAATLYDRLGRDCAEWYGRAHPRTLDAFTEMARWIHDGSRGNP